MTAAYRPTARMERPWRQRGHGSLLAGLMDAIVAASQGHCIVCWATNGDGIGGEHRGGAT
jgi:hypothetical protein